MRDRLYWLTFGGVTLAAALARAQPSTEPAAPPPPLAAEERYPWTASLGLGAVGFTGGTANDASDLGVAYDLRVTYRLNRITPGFAVEGALVGTKQSLLALGLDRSADLKSWGVEALARYDFGRYASANIGRFAGIHPFVFGGVAFQHFSVEDTALNTSDIADDDNVIAIPLGVGGAATVADRVMVEARLSVDRTMNSDLFRSPDGSNADASLSQWNLGLRAGVAF